MTGRRATRREVMLRIAKATAFLLAVAVPVLIFGAIPVYLAGMWAAAVATSMFPVVYSAVAPWWRYALGRVIFGSVTSVALLIDFTLWQILSRSQAEWVIYLGAFLWTSLAAHIAGLTRQLIRAQHQGESRDLDGTTKP